MKREYSKWIRAVSWTSGNVLKLNIKLAFIEIPGFRSNERQCTYKWACLISYDRNKKFFSTLTYFSHYCDNKCSKRCLSAIYTFSISITYFHIWFYTFEFEIILRSYYYYYSFLNAYPCYVEKSLVRTLETLTIITFGMFAYLRPSK